MTLRQICKKGNISVQDFIDFCAFKPARRTHLLEVGYFLVASSLTGEDLKIEEIAEFDYLGENDFRTVKGITGPISGNIFIKLCGKKGYEIIEGDRPYLGEGSVYNMIRLSRN